jgi:hypothetical protein
MLPNSKKLYVPIDREDLDKIIPQQEEVLYSTNMQIRYKIQKRPEELLMGNKSSLAFGGLPGVGISHLMSREMNTFQGKYFTDVLITSEGIALNLPTFELNKRKNQFKRLPPSSHYVPWKQIKLAKNGNITVDAVFKGEINFLSEFETENEFQSRKKSFYGDICKLRFELTSIYLHKAQGAITAEDFQLALNWIERGFRCNPYGSEWDLMEDLTSVKSIIAKAESNKRLHLMGEVEEQLVNFLSSQPGKAFTLKSLLKRLTESLEEPDVVKMLEKNIEGILNRLTFEDKIKSSQHEGNWFYFS